MRKKKLIYNTFSSLLFQLTTVICGFILPRLILNAFGSDVNGLVNSITQFLGIIAFLELGVGSVVQSSLYKPLVEKKKEDISKIISSANKFFKNLARILLVYVVFLIILFPIFIEKKYSFIYTTTLIVAISISSFAQYYFGIVNRLLLTADQRGYVQYTAQTIAVIANTVVCYILVKLNCSIQIIKLVSSLIFLLQPFVIYLYVRKNYNIDLKIKYNEEPIKQKWNGIAQHVAAVILDGTDTVILTLFASLSDVSIYSVYFLVVKGIKQLFMSMTNGITSLIGELWARKELEKLQEAFAWTEWVIHTGTTFVFSITMVLIVPFVKVYTLGISDANYTQPLFAILMVLANAMYCLRLPYNIMILAAGHYKQTQQNYIVAAIMNIIISILAVKSFGLIGVAMGTLIAMVYQTFWMAWYDSKKLVKWPFKKFVKQIIIDSLTFILCKIYSELFLISSTNYLSWCISAVYFSLSFLIIILFINFLFYKEKIYKVCSKISDVFKNA